MSRKPGQDPQKTREAIVAAAERVFAQKGFAATAMSDVAEVAGVTKSLIHHHFGSKVALWEQVRVAQFQAFARSQTEQLHGEPATLEQFVNDSFTDYFRFLQQNPDFLRIMWWAQAEYGAAFQTEVDAAMRQIIDQIGGLAVERILNMQLRGLIRNDLDPRLVFFAYLGLLRQWFVARHDYPRLLGGRVPGEMDEAYLRTVVTLFVDGLRPSAAQPISQNVPAA